MFNVRSLLRLVLSIGVSLVVLGLLMRLATGGGGSQESPELLPVLRRTSLLLVGLYFVFALAQAFFRAVRYRLLIKAAGEDQPPGLFHTCLVTLTRNMLVDMLPARLGELSYIGMMNKGYNVSGKACCSSLGISFLFDFMALLFVIAGVLLYQVFTASLQMWLVSVLIVLSVVVFGMVAVVFAGIRVATKILGRILGSFTKRKVVRQGLAFLEGLASAIEMSREAGVMRMVLILSLCVRFTKYLGLYCIFQAVVAPSFPDLAGAGFGGVLCSLLSAEAGASLPIPAFMSFGTYEAGGMLALTLLGFPAQVSKIAMLGIHIWSQAADYLLGGVGFVTFLMLTGKRRLERPAAQARRRPYALALAAAGVLLAGLAFLGLQYRKTEKMGALVPPPRGEAATPTVQETGALHDAADALEGFVVWSSNRYGNHDILMLELPGLEIRRLTTHPHVDYFPRISPDGKQIVFARSQIPWVSQRNPVPWDVYLLDIETGVERQIASFANTPTWSEDGKTIYFERKGAQFLSFDLESEQEALLFESGKNGVPENAVLQTPAFSGSRAAMAVTLRKGKRGTAVFYTDGNIVPVGGGCQLVWTPEPSRLCYVDSGGRQKNAIYTFDLETRQRTRLLDLTGALSHEYFPRFSRDGQFLVCGASSGERGQHEHDTGDYEIFLWRLGTPPEEAVRLTNHTGNDCWPDIFLK